MTTIQNVNMITTYQTFFVLLMQNFLIKLGLYFNVDIKVDVLKNCK